MKKISFRIFHWLIRDHAQCRIKTSNIYRHAFCGHSDKITRGRGRGGIVWNWSVCSSLGTFIARISFPLPVQVMIAMNVMSQIRADIRTPIQIEPVIVDWPSHSHHTRRSLDRMWLSPCWLEYWYWSGLIIELLRVGITFILATLNLPNNVDKQFLICFRPSNNH